MARQWPGKLHGARPLLGTIKDDLRQEMQKSRMPDPLVLILLDRFMVRRYGAWSGISRLRFLNLYVDAPSQKF